MGTTSAQLFALYASAVQAPVHTPNFRHQRTLRLTPNFDRLRVCVGRDDSWSNEARPFEQSRCFRHANLTETALYGRLSLLSKLLSSHFMISMVSHGSVSKCHESVPSTLLTGGTSAAKVGKGFA